MNRTVKTTRFVPNPVNDNDAKSGNTEELKVLCVSRWSVEKMRAHPRATDKRNARTHTRVQPVFRVFTLGRVAAGVTCTYLYAHTHEQWTQNRHGGACRPHKCACVRDEFMPLCLVHVHAYANTRPPVSYVHACAPTLVASRFFVYRMESGGEHRWSRFDFNFHAFV